MQSPNDGAAVVVRGGKHRDTRKARTQQGRRRWSLLRGRCLPMFQRPRRPAAVTAAHLARPRPAGRRADARVPCKSLAAVRRRRCRRPAALNRTSPEISRCITFDLSGGAVRRPLEGGVRCHHSMSQAAEKMGQATAPANTNSERNNAAYHRTAACTDLGRRPTSRLLAWRLPRAG